MPATLSRVFMNGNSQAVRIPQEFRLATNRVEIFRNAEGELVLHPVPTDRGAALLDTHILIYLMKNKPPQVAERVNALGSEAELCMLLKSNQLIPDICHSKYTPPCKPSTSLTSPS